MCRWCQIPFDAHAVAPIDDGPRTAHIEPAKGKGKNKGSQKGKPHGGHGEGECAATAPVPPQPQPALPVGAQRPHATYAEAVQADRAQQEEQKVPSLAEEVDRLTRLVANTAADDPTQHAIYKAQLADLQAQQQAKAIAEETPPARARRLRRQAKELQDKLSGNIFNVQRKEIQRRELPNEQAVLQEEIQTIEGQLQVVRQQADEACEAAGFYTNATGPPKPIGRDPQDSLEHLQKVLAEEGITAASDALLALHGYLGAVQQRRQHQQEAELQRRAQAVAVDDDAEEFGAGRPIDLEIDEHMELEPSNWLTVGKKGKLLHETAKRLSDESLKEAIKYANTKGEKATGKGKGKSQAAQEVHDGLSAALRGTPNPVTTVHGTETPGGEEAGAAGQATATPQAAAAGCRL